MASKATTWACSTKRKWASELLKQLANGDAQPLSEYKRYLAMRAAKAVARSPAWCSSGGSY
jgi:hypothetical protein